MLRKIITGGQTSAHRVRMLRQVIRITILISLAIGMISFGRHMLQEPKQNFTAVYHLMRCKLSFEDRIVFEEKEWKELTTSSSNFTQIDLSPPKANKKTIQIEKNQALKVCQHRVDSLILHTLTALKRAGYFALGSLLAIFCGFYVLGGMIRRKKSEKGDKLQKWWRLALHLKLTLRASDIKIGRVPILLRSEARHFFISGVNGSGKTNAMAQILSDIRKRGNQAIILDVTGHFIEKFYRKDKDIILNPFDTRSLPWHPWIECAKRNHFREIAQALFPFSTHREENYFQKAARVVVQAAMEKMAVSKDYDMASLVRNFCEKTFAELHKDFQKTKAASYLDPKGERTAHSILTTINNGIEGFSLLEKTKNPFSVRSWILDEKKRDEWLFLSSTEEQRADLRPLLSVWFAIAINAIRSRDRKIAAKNPLFIAIDELHVLKKLECLAEASAELRKYGGCLFLATQDISQLDAIYGERMTESIINNCGTKLCFRQTHRNSAKRISAFFGDIEFREAQEGISYGAHQMRDGVNLSSVEKTKPIVSPSDIQNLPDLQAYLKMSTTARAFRIFSSKPPPATKVSFRYREFPTVSKKCIEKQNLVNINGSFTL